MNAKTLCTVPVSANTPERMVDQAQVALGAGADCLECRLDYLDSLTLPLARSLIQSLQKVVGDTPLIMTCRDPREGASHDYDRTLRLQVLMMAIEAGVEFVDVEVVNYRDPEVRTALDAALSRQPSCRLILSAHDFAGCFANLAGLYRDIQNLNSEAIPKLVYTATHINDCFAAFDLLHQTRGDRIVLCMGPAGVITRILAPKFDATVTFAALDDGAGTAPGQLTLQQMQSLYHAEAINTDTELFGIIADPVGHSMSPAIHNACFRQQGMNRVYLPLWVAGGAAALNEFLENLQQRPWLQARGFSVTIPHKQHALDYVQAQHGKVDPLVLQIGATNTLVWQDGGWAAYNTDYSGAMQAMVSVMGEQGLKDCPVAIIGAGGVARSLVAGLCTAGATVTIYNRTVAKAQQLAHEFNCRAARLEALDQMQANLIVNCTSLGMSPRVDQTPVPWTCLKPDIVVFDTVYNPVHTRLLRETIEQGGRTISGLDMFVHQAREQFRLFTGQEADAELMREVVLEKIGDR